MRVVAYVRRSTRRQALSRAAQLRAIRRECEARGWRLAAVEQDTASGKSRKRRPGLARAVEACRRGDADAIVVARLDRLVRSIADFGLLIEEARDRGFAIVVLDHQLDTSTANGRLVGNILASVAAWEREIISERTRDALAESPRVRRVPPERRAEALRLHAAGWSQRRIAAELGWHKEGVARVLREERARRTRRGLRSVA